MGQKSISPRSEQPEQSEQSEQSRSISPRYEQKDNITEPAATQTASITTKNMSHNTKPRRNRELLKRKQKIFISINQDEIKNKDKKDKASIISSIQKRLESSSPEDNKTLYKKIIQDFANNKEVGDNYPANIKKLQTNYPKCAVQAAITYYIEKEKNREIKQNAIKRVDEYKASGFSFPIIIRKLKTEFSDSIIQKLLNSSSQKDNEILYNTIIKNFANNKEVGDDYPANIEKLQTNYPKCAIDAAITYYIEKEKEKRYATLRKQNFETSLEELEGIGKTKLTLRRFKYQCARKGKKPEDELFKLAKTDEVCAQYALEHLSAELKKTDINELKKHYPSLCSPFKNTM